MIDWKKPIRRIDTKEEQIKALYEAIQHWKRMRNWADTQIPSGIYNTQDMLLYLGEKPNDYYCPLCNLNKGTCTNCILKIEIGNCGYSNTNLYSWVVKAKDWHEFSERATEFIAQLLTLGRTTQRCYNIGEGLDFTAEKTIEKPFEQSLYFFDKEIISDVLLYADSSGVKESLEKATTKRLIKLASIIHVIMYRRLNKEV